MPVRPGGGGSDGSWKRASVDILANKENATKAMARVNELLKHSADMESEYLTQQDSLVIQWQDGACARFFIFC